MEIGESKYLAIDPGHTSGWALFDAKGELMTFGQFKMNEITDKLRHLVHENLLVCIVEDYKNLPWKPKASNFSRNETSKIIGKIELVAELRGVPVVLQPNTILDAGYAWGGFEQPSNHSISHQFDAVAHGIYYLQTNGIRPVGKLIIERDSKK